MGMILYFRCLCFAHFIAAETKEIAEKAIAKLIKLPNEFEVIVKKTEVLGEEKDKLFFFQVEEKLSQPNNKRQKTT